TSPVATQAPKMNCLSLRRPRTRHLKRPVIGRAAVSGGEAGRRRLPFVMIKPAGKPAQISVALKSEGLVRRLDCQRHGVTEAEHLLVPLVKAGLIPAVGVST